MSDTATIDPKYLGKDGKIKCAIDGAEVHVIKMHLRDNHPDWTIERYQKEYPDAPLVSPLVAERVAKKVAEQKSAHGDKSPVTSFEGADGSRAQAGSKMKTRTAYFHEIFELGEVDAAMSSVGKKPIPITVVEGGSEDTLPYRQKVDPDYVFNIDLVKKVIVGFELNMPVYLWGYHGTGKTTVLQQAAARTGRPFLRVQHTINTEEAHILGQYVVKDGETVFQLGPLPLAMLHGMVYCADEYDFAMPSVSAVYQSVLEGQPLVIKDAPVQYRVIEPHPEFRFVATGNTNGVGDETGLYQGTMIQNAANYSRFPITEEVKYMEPKIEESILRQKTNIDKSNASKIVKFANDIRRTFADGKIGLTISPRELLNATKLAIAFGGNFRVGLQLAFANRCSRVDKKVVEELMQRIFGEN